MRTQAGVYTNYKDVIKNALDNKVLAIEPIPYNSTNNGMVNRDGGSMLFVFENQFNVKDFLKTIDNSKDIKYLIKWNNLEVVVEVNDFKAV